jgi:hypothetical protein
VVRGHSVAAKKNEMVEKKGLSENLAATVWPRRAPPPSFTVPCELRETASEHASWRLAPYSAEI